MTESAEQFVSAWIGIDPISERKRIFLSALAFAHQERDEANRRADEATAREAVMREALEKMLAHARGTVKWFEAQSLADAALVAPPPQALADLEARVRADERARWMAEQNQTSGQYETTAADNPLIRQRAQEG